MLTFLAEAYLHALDPFAIRITDSFGVRWYGLSYAAGFVIAWALIEWLATPEVQKKIGSYAVNGEALFHPLLLGGE